MFRNSYQNGPMVQVFDSKGVNFTSQQVKERSLRKSLQSQQIISKLKSYLVELEGYGTRLNFPKDDSKELGLMQNYLVLQIFIQLDQPWSIQLGITDTTKTKRRVNITNVSGKIQKKFFHMRYPCQQIRKDIWLNLSINLYSFINAFKGQSFRSLDQISIGSHCRLRRIFTMKERLIQISNEVDDMAERHTFGVYVPKNYAFPPSIKFANQVIDFVEEEASLQKSPKQMVIFPPISKKMTYDFRPELKNLEFEIQGKSAQMLYSEKTGTKKKLLKEKEKQKEKEMITPLTKSNRNKSKDRKKFKPKQQPFLSDMEQTKIGLLPHSEQKKSRQKERDEQFSIKFRQKETFLQVPKKEAKQKKRIEERKEIIEEIDEWEQRQPEEELLKKQFLYNDSLNSDYFMGKLNEIDRKQEENVV